MRIFDFRCPEGHVTEDLVQPNVTHIRCKCGQQADRIISGTCFHLNGSDQAYPTAHARWVREHERAGKQQ